MGYRLGIDYKPRGDQGAAIDQLVRGVEDGEQHQVLLGVTRQRQDLHDGQGD